MHTKLLVLLSSYIISSIALACVAPAKGLFTHLDDLIEITDHIVLAEFWCEAPDTLPCEFRVRETLKGPKEDTVAPIDWIRHAFRAVREGTIDPPNDFDAHRSPDFWQMREQRADFSPGSCTPRFTFMPGKTYLIFVDSPANYYAAELILSEDDAWLSYVRKKVQEDA